MKLFLTRQKDKDILPIIYLKRRIGTVVNRAFYGLDLESLDITESSLGRLQIGQFSEALL